MDPAVVWSILGALSFLPPAGFLLWVRNRELRGREPLAPTFGVFLYGATLGIALALVLGLLLQASIGSSLVFVSAVVVAPLVEELAKGLGIGLARRHVDELEDGLVYGAAVGLGFAATETLLYALDELTRSSLASAVAVVAARNISSLLLHAASSALLGFGYAVARVRGAGLGRVVPYYLVAVVVHALYNALVLSNNWAGFALAIVAVVALMSLLMRQLRRLDLAPQVA